MISTLRKILAILVICNSSYAASFNCTQAHTNIEHLICSDTELSTLDNELDRRYQQALKLTNNVSYLVRDQRKWISEKRNTCQDLACLNREYQMRIADLGKMVTLKAEVCPISEQSLIGYWEENGAGDFEEMNFDISNGKHVFTSWRNHRLEAIGLWKFRGCELSIYETGDASEVPFSYRIQKRSTSNALHLLNIPDSEESQYKKMK